MIILIYVLILKQKSIEFWKK